MTKIIAIFNQAGGVAKTTLTMNLGYQLAQNKNRVLLIDVDPQASLSTFMGIEPDDLEKSLYETIIEERPLFIQEDLHGMDLAPTNLDLSTAEMLLVSAELREYRLKNAIEPVTEYYDFILIDCPPSLGLLSVISLAAATHVLVPVETQFKAFQGTNKLLETVARIKSKINRKLKIAGFVPTIYDGRNSQDVRSLAAMHEQLAGIGTVFDPIPRSTIFADASEKRQPLAVLQPRHPAVPLLKKLASAMEKLN